MPFDLPSHEHYVSAVALDGDNISVRMLSDPHAGTDTLAFEVKATRVAGAQHVLKYLSRSEERRVGKECCR